VATRNYDDSCGIARALDLVGDRWTLLVVRELLLGPKRFTDLQGGLGRIGPDVLTQRLRDLRHAGLVEREGQRTYRLSDLGRQLQPVLLALGRFGSALPLPDEPAPLGTDATGVALLTMFDPLRAGRLDGRYELRLDAGAGAEPFAVTVADGRLQIVRGSVDRPLTRLTTSTTALVAVLWHGRDLDEAVRAGDLRIDGELEEVRRLLSLFSGR
jgi:DNA-binding HxlR family transcriptional regulator